MLASSLAYPSTTTSLGDREQITMKLLKRVLTSASILNALLFSGEGFVLSADLPSRQRRGVGGHVSRDVASSTWFQNAQRHGLEESHWHKNRLYFSTRGGAEHSDSDDTSSSSPELEQLPKNHIQVSSQIELPFSAEIAFDAFSDLPRQSTWSPWLTSVKYVNREKTKNGDSNDSSNNRAYQETKWTMKSILGVSYSWNAISTRLERPYLIEWESCKGLKNWGRVEFIPCSTTNATTTTTSTTTTLMQLTLTFVAPRLVARWFQNHPDGGLARLVQQRIVGGTLRNFRDICLAHDVPQRQAAQQEQAQEAVATPKRDLALLGPPRERYQSIVKDRS